VGRWRPWHATSEGDESELRHIDPRTGEVLEKLEMPHGVYVSGMESDGGDQFFCGGGNSGKVRVVRRPPRGGLQHNHSLAEIGGKGQSVKTRRRGARPTRD
jgi:hypothetical protein